MMPAKNRKRFRDGPRKHFGDDVVSRMTLPNVSGLGGKGPTVDVRTKMS